MYTITIAVILQVTCHISFVSFDAGFRVEELNFLCNLFFGIIPKDN